MTTKNVDLRLGFARKHFSVWFFFVVMMPSGQDTQRDKNNMIITIQKHILQTIPLLSAIQVH